LEALIVDGVSRFFGGVRALNHVSLAIPKGERRGIIGPNGAGKTTLFRVISGEMRPTGGRVILNGDEITGLDQEKIAVKGLGRTFQRNNLFPRLTLYDNVLLGALSGRAACWNPLKSTGRCRELAVETEEILEKMGIRRRRNTPVGRLSYGEQRQVEIAIALATRPSVLLMDEPTAGMSPGETLEMIEMLSALPKEITLVVIEHDISAIFSLAERITVLHHGEVIADASAHAVRNDPEVNRVFFEGGSVRA
jgi:branched-chain amino acid transport system ATP-binding protein